jgi:hypothetical protein
LFNIYVLVAVTYTPHVIKRYNCTLTYHCASDRDGS